MSKLTLSIDEQVISKAKYYARKSRRSLSEIVETYLDIITREEKPEQDEELDRITGIIQLEEDFDEKKEVRKILTNKHLK
ncbi:MAG: DUF6364 family protein [Cyclobacteriaceae bacterium]|nr:DUF6364 family protein [Cyclobacteriaceae bacterium]